MNVGLPRAADFEEAKERLAKGIAASSGDAVRVEVPVDPIDARQWLQAQSSEIKVLWSDRDGAMAVAGVGAAHEVVAASGEEYDACFETMERCLDRAWPWRRYYGGLRFDPAGETNAAWHGFGALRFFLPLVELIHAPDGCCSLACNVVASGQVCSS